MRLERNKDLQQFYNNEMTLDGREIWMSICLFFKINLNYFQQFFHVIIQMTICNLYILEKVQIFLLLGLKYEDLLKTFK